MIHDARIRRTCQRVQLAVRSGRPWSQASGGAIRATASARRVAPPQLQRAARRERHRRPPSSGRRGAGPIHAIWGAGPSRAARCAHTSRRASASAPALTPSGAPRAMTYARWAATHATSDSASGAPSWSRSSDDERRVGRRRRPPVAGSGPGPAGRARRAAPSRWPRPPPGAPARRAPTSSEWASSRRRPTRGRRSGLDGGRGLDALAGRGGLGEDELVRLTAEAVLDQPVGEARERRAARAASSSVLRSARVRTSDRTVSHRLRLRRPAG